LSHVYAILGAALLFVAFGLLKPRGCGACDGVRCGSCPHPPEDGK
jgi:hypothetical protein